MNVSHAVRELLRSHVGFSPGTLGDGAYESAIAARTRATRLSPADWLAKVLRDPEELEALVEALVVSETWFFRDEMPFIETVRHAIRKLPDAQSPYRVLSLPCATGEEAYSLAIALREGGLSPAQFRIDGIDVSAHALARAAQGTYRNASFRSPRAEASKDQWFVANGETFTIRPFLRESITFRRGNAMEPGTFSASAPYDCIFCRNLLIYFDRPAREALVARLREMLGVGGLLFVGHAESLAGFDRGLKRLPDVRAFGYQRVVEEDATSTPAEPARAPRTRRTTDGSRFLGQPSPAALPPLERSSAQRIPRQSARPDTSPLLGSKSSVTQAAPVPSIPGSKSSPRIDDTGPLPSAKSEPRTIRARDPLEEARALADRGALADARALLETALMRPTAEGFHLLGVIAQGEGRSDEAERCFTRALYLDSQHYASLVQMALLRERRGDPGAAQFRARANRIRRPDGEP